MWIPISATLRAIDKQHFGPTSFTFLFVFPHWWNVLPVGKSIGSRRGRERTQQIVCCKIIECQTWSSEIDPVTKLCLARSGDRDDDDDDRLHDRR